MKSKIWDELERIHLKPGTYKYFDLSYMQLEYIEKVQKIKLGRDDTIIINFDNLQYLEWLAEKQGSINA
jgi:hypothetical protein